MAYQNFQSSSQNPSKTGLLVGLGFLCYYICICCCVAIIIIIALAVVLGRRDNFPLFSVQIDGVQRNYILRLPSGINASANALTKYPLIIGLHGGFGNARNFERDNGFEALQKNYKFIGLYPYGYDPKGRLSLLAWNSGHLDVEAYREGINDARFINTLIGQIIEKYPVDPKNISCIGHSNGAMMCYRLVGEFAQRINSIATVSGSIGGQINRNFPEVMIPVPSKQVALLHVHGEADVNVPFNGGLSSGAGSQLQGGRYDIAVNRSVAFFRSLNNCSSDFSLMTSPNSWVKHYKYSCNGRPTQLMTFPRRYHGWEDMNAEIVEEKWIATSLAEFIWKSLISMQ